MRETWQGSVVSIHVALEAGAPMLVVPEARALRARARGRSLRDDRGHYSPRPSQGGREITLIETETLEALGGLDVKLSPAETRRNVATRGVPLTTWWTASSVSARFPPCAATRLCEPCKYLDGLTRDGVMAALVHRGGLRAQILGEGVIRVGDIVRPE